MKKLGYQKPVIEVVELQQRNRLLAGSGGSIDIFIGGEGSVSGIGSADGFDLGSGDYDGVIR